jgi:uncharacterized membrane protein
MDDVAIARALHVLAVVHWIGGVAMVTTVILPAIAQSSEPSRRLDLFEAIEARFGRQARVSVTVAGATGFYMAHRLAVWDRFLDPAFWWMHAMLLVWAIFTIVLFLAEPLFLHDWFRRSAARRPEETFAFIRRAHWILLLVTGATVAAAVLGARGALSW